MIFHKPGCFNAPTMTIQLKKLQSPTSVLTDWDNAIVEPTDVPQTQIAGLPSPPTAWLSARDMKVFGSIPLREQIGIVRCRQCDRPVLRSAFADHYGELHHPPHVRIYGLKSIQTANCATLRATLVKKGGKGLEGTLPPPRRQEHFSNALKILKKARNERQRTRSTIQLKRRRRSRRPPKSPRAVSKVRSITTNSAA